MDIFHVFRAALVFSMMATASIAIGQQPSFNSTAVESPTNSAEALGQIRRMIERGESSEALKQLDQLKSQPSPPSGVDRLRGLAFYSQNRFAEADSAFASAIRADVNDQEAIQMRGLTLYRLGKPAEAIPLLEAAHQWTSETKYDPNYVLALCYIDTRRYDDARHAFAAQYGFAPDSAPAYLLAARMLFRREYLTVAQDFATKALQIEPALPLAHGLLGEISLALEHPDVAIGEFEKERARNPLEGGVYERLGDAYTRTGNYPKAAQVLQQALLLEPNATGPYILLGKVLLRQEDPANAAMYLERAQKMDPKNSMTHTLLAQSYRAMGRADDAAREMQIVQKLQSTKEADSEPRR